MSVISLLLDDNDADCVAVAVIALSAAAVAFHAHNRRMRRAVSTHEQNCSVESPTMVTSYRFSTRNC